MQASAGAIRGPPCQVQSRGPVAGAAAGLAGGCEESQSIRAAGNFSALGFSPNTTYDSSRLFQAGHAISFSFGVPESANAISEWSIVSDSLRSSSVQARVGRNRLNASSVPNQYGTSAV